MNELYWITRLDTLNSILFTIMIISGIVGVVSMLGLFVLCIDDYDTNEFRFLKSVRNKSLTVFISVCLPYVFIPTQKQALIIWGVGGTIDYIKSNDTAKQLPDKCINALDKFIDEYMDDENTKNNNNKEE